jgi:xanthine dehydrogenase molybdenum-binding subunit
MTTGNGRRDTAPQPAGTFRVIGTRPGRADAADKVTGRAVFGADVRLPGMIVGLVLRSPHAHARIVSIDTSDAERLPGVLAVITARDLWPTAEWGTPVNSRRKFFRDNYLASDKVLHKGHPIAAVAAVDRFVADEALTRIRVEYELLPPVLDVLEAMQDGAPCLHERLETAPPDQATGQRGNVASHFTLMKGDPEAGFAQADHVVEREFRTATVHQGYLESHVATAVWGPDGTLTIWCTNQGHFWVRRDVARLLGCQAARVRVVPTEVGGGFGGKTVSHLEPLAALLASKSGRPVRMAMGRAETFEATGPASGTHMTVKVGATRDGRLTAVQADLRFEAGAFPGSSVGAAARCIFAPYEFPHGQVDGYDVVVNKPKSEAYRAPGVPQACFAAESVMDELAEKLGLDPLEFRLKNVAAKGTVGIDGVVFPAAAFSETIRAALAHPHYRAPLPGPHRGRGVAVGVWHNVGLESSASVSVSTDGSVNVTTGSVDLQGTRMAIAMQVAETLQIAVADVHPAVGDTDSVGFCDVTGGSRVTFATGSAAILAARKALEQMGERAALMWGVSPGTVTYADGAFITSTDPGKRLAFQGVAAKLSTTGGPVFTSASCNLATGGPAIGVQIADVEVDPQTGQVRVLRYTALQDVGKAVHPGLVEGQIQGGVVQGIGWALWEGYRYDAEGRLQNRSFLDYKLPTALDLPMIDTLLVEAVPNPDHAYGVRGVGETPIILPPAAVANAIHRATGVRLRTLPLSPDRILQALGVIA